MPATPPPSSPATPLRPRTATARLRRLLGPLALVGFVLATWTPGLGLASTVAEQRARLPPPAACQDPIAGIWKSHSYDQVFRDWTIFTLVVERSEPGKDEFEGSITNESWLAEPHESSPPQCRGELHYIVSMDAQGSFRDGRIDFWGVGTWRLEDVPCGSFNMGYNLDHFSGQIDPELMEFQSVNNDGG
ncbi:MAG: hypothetical protein KC431_25085, partial [Myxococcales bacterium]|nr:hypothetical protein [Myxococcales bacterium]